MNDFSGQTENRANHEQIASDKSAPLSIGSRAPDFTARSTQGQITLSDHRGHWLLFFSHPASFTPVCTSEFIAFQKAQEDFDAQDCRLLGVSVDGLYAHIAWTRDIEENFGIHIRFPIVEDVSMAVSKAYGMIHEHSSSTAAVRSVFFIDPDGFIRALIHYPPNVGRSVQELLRVLQALQQTDLHQVSTPEGWQTGDNAFLSPPMNQQQANERASTNKTPWYMTPVKLDS